jgi:glycosyltransferase involved in cell wall biosynthesis
MTSTKISIVTPSFNQARFVEETINSVLGQNYENLEYVVIDGGSTDGSDALIEKYRRYLHYYVSEPDLGHGNALNKGFSQTTGHIMAWLNSDDKYLPWTFRTVSEIFEEHPDINWIVGTHGFWNDRGALTNTNEFFRNIVDYLSGQQRYIQQESVFWRRSLWEKAGGYIDESYRLMVDGELWCRFFALDRLWHVRCVLSGYRMHAGNRGRVFDEDCTAEMKRAIAALRERVNIQQLRQADLDYMVLRYDLQNSHWLRGRIRRERLQRRLREIAKLDRQIDQ